MLWILIIDVAIAAALMAAWYAWFARQNRQRSLHVVHAIKAAFDNYGQVTAFRWLAPSRFLVRLRLAPSVFRCASVTVHMTPREMPLAWLWSWLRKRQETLTFEADLDCPPSFNLEVHNHRWCGRSGRQFPRKRNYIFEQCGPFVLTTRTDWQRDITSMMTALVASRESDFLTVNFRRNSPHFAATVALDSFATCAAEMAGVLRELANCASAASF